LSEKFCNFRACASEAPCGRPSTGRAPQPGGPHGPTLRGWQKIVESARTRSRTRPGILGAGSGQQHGGVDQRRRCRAGSGPRAPAPWVEGFQLLDVGTVRASVRCIAGCFAGEGKTDAKIRSISAATRPVRYALRIGHFGCPYDPDRRHVRRCRLDARGRDCVHLWLTLAPFFVPLKAIELHQCQHPFRDAADAA